MRAIPHPTPRQALCEAMIAAGPKGRLQAAAALVLQAGVLVAALALAVAVAV